MQQQKSQLPRTVSQLIAAPFELGAAIHLGSLTVFPIFGAPAELAVLPFAEALAQGVVAKELPGQPSVNDLIIENPTGSSVLLLDGEEVLGAKQNRVFDGSVIVPARSEVRVAVCCVEKGRWDGARSREHFHASRQVAPPRLRREMSVTRSRSREGRASQDGVWRTVTSTLTSGGISSRTESLDDAFSARDASLARMVEAAERREGQLGAMVFIGGRFTAFDFVAHPAAYARLHERLIRGYALQALEVGSRDMTLQMEADVVLELVSQSIGESAAQSCEPGEGSESSAGVQMRFGDESTLLRGTGLAAGEQLVQCSLFPNAA